jgi:hypothetical protein
MAIHAPALAYVTTSRVAPPPPTIAEAQPMEVTLTREAAVELRREESSPTEAPALPGVAGHRAIVDGTIPRGAASAAASPEPSPTASNEAAPAAAASSATDSGTDAERSARARSAVASLFSGVPGALSAMPEGPSAPLADGESKDKAGKLLRDALGEHDRSVGLGAGGPVVSAARSVLSSPNAPSEGVASYQVITDADGNVTQVRMLDANGDGWNKLAASLLGTLKGQKLRVPPGARGLSVTVRVEAKYQLPSGAKAERSYGATSFSQEFDLSDIAAKKVRTTSARVTGEAAL